MVWHRRRRHRLWAPLCVPDAAQRCVFCTHAHDALIIIAFHIDAVGGAGDTRSAVCPEIRFYANKSTGVSFKSAFPYSKCVLLQYPTIYMRIYLHARRASNICSLFFLCREVHRTRHVVVRTHFLHAGGGWLTHKFYSIFMSLFRAKRNESLASSWRTHKCAHRLRDYDDVRAFCTRVFLPCSSR